MTIYDEPIFSSGVCECITCDNFYAIFMPLLFLIGYRKKFYVESAKTALIAQRCGGGRDAGASLRVKPVSRGR